MYSRRSLIILASVLFLVHGGNVVPAQDKPLSSCTPRESEKDVTYHAQYLKDKETQLKKGPIQLVFVGDSITNHWSKTGKSVWDKYYGKYNALNLGVGGDKTENVLWRIDHGELDGLSPKVVVLMIGTNNHSSPVEEIVAGVKCDISTIHKKLPEAKILLLGVFPRANKADDPLRDKIKQVNAAISQLDGKDSVTYLDFGKKFLESDGTLSKTIMPDYLHPNEKGYVIWAEAMRAKLDEMMK